MMDIVINAGNKFALEQWLDARGLGDSYQDTDANSPTFGDWFYTHTDKTSTFLWWNEPSGKLPASIDNTDPENPVTTFFNGFYSCLRFKTVEDMEATDVATWTRNSTATSIVDGFNGVGGEGVTLISPEDIEAHLDGIGATSWGILGGMQWSNPEVWYLSPVMTGDEREFDGVIYESLIDFNVWTPVTYPAGWLDKGAPTPVESIGL